VDIMTSRFCFWLLILVTVASTETRADVDESSLLMLYGDEHMISIATGTSRPISKAPSVTSVITVDEIKAMGARNVYEALERVPGMHVGISGSEAQKPIFPTRGIISLQDPQILILVNGHGIKGLTTSSNEAGLYLPTEAVQRIEVIRGPGSAIYGADAFAGVINIITKNAADLPGVEFGLRGGSFNTRDGWAQFGTQFDNGWGLFAHVGYSKSNGDQGRIITSDQQTALDGALGSHASLAPGPMDTSYEARTAMFTLNNDNWTAHLNLWQTPKSGLSAGIANALDNQGNGNVNKYLFDLGYEDKNWRPDWVFATQFSYLYTHIDYRLGIFPRGATLPIGADGNINFAAPVGVVTFPDGLIGIPGREEKTTQFDVTLNYIGLDRHAWRFNAGVRKEDFSARESKNFGPGIITGLVTLIGGTLTDVTGTSFVYLPDTTRNVSYLSVQDEWSFAPDWALTAGVRRDQYSDFGGSTNPRLALVWAARQDLTAKLLYGEAFRAPSFAELKTVNNPANLGNPSVQPETIKTSELAFDYRPSDKLWGALNVFSYDIKGLIDFIPGPLGNVAQNAKNQQGKGIEMEAHWQILPSLQILGDLSMQNAKDKNTGAPVADAPRKQAMLSADWRIDSAWSVRADNFRVADRLRATGDARPAVADYVWSNLTLRFRQPAEKWEAALTVRNLFDVDAREPAPAAIPNDYPLPGRSLMLEVRAHL
jgi:iron complex outermembrane receptor protein